MSDWLTKIIIGITLTQLGKIPGYLHAMVNYVIDNSNQMFDLGAPAPFLFALIIYSSITGFVVGYYYTRIYLPNLFSIMEENRKQKAVIAILNEEVLKKEKLLCNHPDSEVGTS